MKLNLDKEQAGWQAIQCWLDLVHVLTWAFEHKSTYNQLKSKKSQKYSCYSSGNIFD